MTDSVEAAQRAARVDLAAAYRLVAHYGWDDLISTHISARVPGAEGRFLLNPQGLLFREIKASSLVTIDVDGNVISPAGARVNAAGFTIHSAIHAAHPDVGCVIHLHAACGTAVSMLADGLMPVSQKALVFQERLAYHDYEGLAFNLDERERLVSDLGDKRAMILRNHGTLAIGRTVAEAFTVIYQLERACEVQILAQSTGQRLAMPSEGSRRRVAQQSAGAFMEKYADMTWPALLRMLDDADPSYRQ